MPTATPEMLYGAVLHEAVRGLSATPKTLSPWLFYDEAGSHLFDQITELPEYYLTRTERGIFTQLATDLPARLAGAVTIAELGAGSAGKTGVLLSAFAKSQGSVLYQPIDISPTALEEARTSLEELMEGVRVQPQVANYITERYEIARPAGHQVLALYIGSSIGNFSPEEGVAILRNLREHLEPGDWLLLGTDLAPGEGKSVQTLLAAYDDAAGVTAAFNKNVLTRLNREVEANFDLREFAHLVRWNAKDSRIEMHLQSVKEQTVEAGGHRFHFARGETIHTENSYKFTEAALQNLMKKAGFAIEYVANDAAHLFAVTLARAT